MPSFTRFTVLLALVVAFVLSTSSAQVATRGADTVAFPTFSLAQLQTDFDYFRANVARHPLLYADGAALEVVLDAARAELRDGMSELEYYRVLSGLVRRLNCGHTTIALSYATENAVYAQRRALPMQIETIDDRLFALKVVAGVDVPAGAEILAINGRNADAVLEQMMDRLPADGSNLTFKQAVINRRFGHWYHLLVDASSEFEIEYLDPLKRTRMSAVVDGASGEKLAELDAAPQPDNDGLGTTLFAADHAELFVKSFFYYDAAARSRFNAFIDGFFNEVAARDISRVLIDLRGNGGGDPYCGAYLFARLIDQPRTYFNPTTFFYEDLKHPLNPASNAFTGELTVLVDGGCFSTTGHFLSLLKYHRIGTIVGEESGGSFACTSNNSTVTLFPTGLRFSVALNTFTTAVTGLEPGRGVQPDYPITPTAADRMAGRDVVKEFALSLIQNPAVPVVVTRHPEAASAAEGGEAVLSLQVAQSFDDATIHWTHNGTTIPNAVGSRLELAPMQRSSAGLYTAVVAAEGGRATRPAIVGWVGPEKSAGGIEIGVDIQHMNTNVYDQVLVREPVASVTADSGQITRVSFLDLQDDIVQVEFSGAGTLTVALDGASGPTAPVRYVQPGVDYLKGHARIVIAGADESTNVSVFSVGRVTAGNPNLFCDDVEYDGWADIASISILSTNGRFGGVLTGNTRYSGVRGAVGLYAPDVAFAGRVAVGDLHAAEEATPVLVAGAAGSLAIAGGDLEQLNGRAVELGGAADLSFTSGSDAHGRIAAVQVNRARFERDGMAIEPALVTVP